MYNPAVSLANDQAVNGTAPGRTALLYSRSNLKYREYHFFGLNTSPGASAGNCPHGIIGWLNFAPADFRESATASYGQGRGQLQRRPRPYLERRVRSTPPAACHAGRDRDIAGCGKNPVATGFIDPLMNVR